MNKIILKSVRGDKKENIDISKRKLDSLRSFLT